MTDTKLLFDGPKEAPVSLVLAHGAGAPMDSPFMAHLAEGLGARGLRIARFEFPYMAARRRDGKKRPPDRAPVLLETWRAVIAEFCGPGGGPGGGPDLAIGGKSLGGRMASLIADEIGVGALVCLGYPFHPPGRPEKLRTEHLETLETPCLILQGERDPLGTRDEVAGYSLSPAIRLAWCPDGDHSFKPRKASGRSQEDNWDLAVSVLFEYLTGRAS
jgi:predicted alpha/beta-hydrolase family hydrolase